MSYIVDPYGRPVTSAAGLYKTPSSNPNASRPKPELRRRTFENVTAAQRRDLINWCWGIYAKIPNISAALDFKSDFACSDGCFLEYHGQNKEWGLRAEQYINEVYYADCNLAGSNHDFHSTLWTASIALETHGQFGWAFDSDTGRVKIISGSSIGNGMSPDSKSGAVYELGKADSAYAYWGVNAATGGYSNLLKITRGPFAGAFLIDGIIVDARMVTLGYRLIGFDETGAASYADLPTSQMGLVFEPAFTDQIMGYPGLSPLVEAVGTVDDWNYYIGQAMKLSAAFAVTRKSRDGNPKRSGRAMLDEDTIDSAGNAATRVVAREIVQAGLVELATENNEEIGHVPFERPSMNEEAFIARIETGFFAKHWPRAFIYTEGQGRAATRVDVIHARQKAWKRHRTLCRFGVNWLRRKIAHAMAHGEIPRNENLFDPYNIGLSTPAELSVDEGNDAKVDMLKLSRGAISNKTICSKAGYNEERIEAENRARLSRLMDLAIALANEKVDAEGKPIWSPKEIKLMFDTGDSNVSFSDNAQAAPAGETAADPPGRGVAGTEAAP